jgi:DNA-directed RNA polymerase sigma subunit (sigma70/sigma32)
VLKAIKEVELDYQMRKIAERDYREMVERYRTRALRLMTEIEAGDDFRSLIEKELAMRLKLEGARPAAEPSKSVASPAAAVITLNLAEQTRQALANLSTEEEKVLRERYGTGESADHAQRPACGSCGTTNDNDARFCKKCGAKLASS